MADLKREITDIARHLGIVDIGFADVALWDTDPIVSGRIARKNRPASVMQGSRTAIVLGIPIPSLVA